MTGESVSESESAASFERPSSDREGRHRVLIVDDEPHLLDGVRAALHREPYEILTAGSAKQALELLDRQQVDVVVSDHRMPGMSGAEFMSVVRRRYPDTVRIILTGHANLEMALEAINKGEIYRFLTKPLSPLELAHTVHDALLLRNMTKAGARLLAAARARRSVLEGLEQEHPGISQVARTTDGRIVLEGTDDDAETLLDEMRREATLFETNRGEPTDGA